MDSLEQMKLIAEQCHDYTPVDKGAFQSNVSGMINCTMCKHYNKGLCKIKDDILINMDQT